MGERLTTPKAEKHTGVSRWALLRAQKSGALAGQRDNKGRWIWDTDDLDAWLAQRPKGETLPEQQQEPAHTSKLAEARERAAAAEGEAKGLRIAVEQAEKRAEAAERRAENAEAETARLREAAERRRGWWPFGR